MLLVSQSSERHARLSCGADIVLAGPKYPNTTVYVKSGNRRAYEERSAGVHTVASAFHSILSRSTVDRTAHVLLQYAVYKIVELKKKKKECEWQLPYWLYLIVLHADGAERRDDVLDARHVDSCRDYCRVKPFVAHIRSCGRKSQLQGWSDSGHESGKSRGNFPRHGTRCTSRAPTVLGFPYDHPTTSSVRCPLHPLNTYHIFIVLCNLIFKEHSLIYG